jgi:hypothetical protein
MENEFISYQQALELKELGFDEPCLGYHNYNGTHFFDYKPKTDDKNLTKAPLYQQAFRWFREKYNLVIVIKPIDDKKLELGYNLTKNGLIIRAYTTYGKAELACLIKLIEITKTK